jgi:hypothetical protein
VVSLGTAPAPPGEDDRPRRTPQAAYALGVCLVVAGGLVAAASGPLDLAHGSWLAAYLVLVCGVAQALMSAAQRAFSPEPVAARVWVVQVICWNVGNALVIVGVLMDAALVVDAGAVPLVVTLGLAVRAVWPPPRRPALAAWGYLAVLVVLIVSIPVGLVLTHVRGG